MIQRHLVFRRHPERSEGPPHFARTTQNFRVATTLVPRGFSLGSHTTPERKGALAPEARP